MTRSPEVGKEAKVFAPHTSIFVYLQLRYSLNSSRFHEGSLNVFGVDEV